MEMARKAVNRQILQVRVVTAAQKRNLVRKKKVNKTDLHWSKS